ncbi:hypothetical protein BGZ83_006373 [Gryganskiella cystojenkinii]|nr:hypothetical protein BGZ83_006373 [Gryganskiella cystojenkinii]
MVHNVPNANSEETLEELRRVVVTLPHMPKNIVDDTRHEKVLSYVSAFIAQADPQLMRTMLNDWVILDVLQVLTAACQFLVAIIENRSTGGEKTTAHDTLMDTLLESIALYQLIESMMRDQTSERNRLAGLEFLWMVTNTRSDRGAAFLRQSQLFYSYMEVLMDDSRLVRSRALDVLSTLLDSAADPLAVLGRGADNSDIMDMDQSKDEALVDCFNFMLENEVCSLLKQTESLKALHVATGIIDTMIMPLSHSKEMNGKGTQFKETILAIVLWIIQAMQDFNTSDASTANRPKVDIVVIPGSGKVASLLNATGFQNVVRVHGRQKPLRGAASRGGTLPKTIVLSAFKALQSLASLFQESVEKSEAIAITLSVLFDHKLRSDQRVFKSCLATLPVVLKTKVQNGKLLDEQLFSSAMKVILGLIQRPGTGSTSLRLILTAIQEFFADSILGKILLQEKVGQDLSNGLGLKLYDMEWDVRDNGGPEHGVEWALKYDMLESIFQKLSDEEAYVRAASVHAFEVIMRDPRGWKGMCEKNLDERLSAQLPTLIRDSEAFVRRAVLEAMICLVSERESGTVLMVNGTDLFVDAHFMSRLTLDDADWEVRIRACEFLAAVWEHSVALDERADYRIRASKRIKDSDREALEEAAPARPSTWWFYDIKGDQILVEASRDSSRMVRLTSVETLKKIKASIEKRLGPDMTFEASTKAQTSPSGVKIEGGLLQRKRFAISSDTNGSSSPSDQDTQPSMHPHAAFYEVLCGLDFERLDASTSVEQLYEEVLNVERVEDVVMAESEKPNDGNNVLDCY